MSELFDFDHDGAVTEEEEEEGFLLMLDDDEKEEEGQGGASRAGGCLTALLSILIPILFLAAIL